MNVWASEGKSNGLKCPVGSGLSKELESGRKLILATENMECWLNSVTVRVKTTWQSGHRGRKAKAEMLSSRVTISHCINSGQSLADTGTVLSEAWRNQRHRSKREMIFQIRNANGKCVQLYNKYERSRSDKHIVQIKKELGWHTWPYLYVPGHLFSWR